MGKPRRPFGVKSKKLGLQNLGMNDEIQCYDNQMDTVVQSETLRGVSSRHAAAAAAGVVVVIPCLGIRTRRAVVTTRKLGVRPICTSMRAQIKGL